MDDSERRSRPNALQATASIQRLGTKLLDHISPNEVRQAFKLDTIAGILGGLHVGLYSPFLGKIARDNLHASILLISLLSAAPCIGPLLSPIWARHISGKNKMPFVVWSGTFGRAMLLFMVLVTSGWSFVFLVSISQIIGSIAAPAYSTLMKEIYPDRVRGRCMGMVRVGIQTATFFIALIAGKLLDSNVYAFHWVFPIAAIIGIVSSQIFGRIKATPIDGHLNYKPQVLDTFRILKNDLHYRRFAFAVFLFGVGNLVAVPAMVVHQVDNLHIRNEYIAYLVNVSALTSIPFYFFWGRYLDRHGPLKAVKLSMFLAVMVPVVYLFAHDWKVLILASIMSGISASGIDLSYLNSILQFARNDRIPQYQSAHSFLFGVRGTMAPFLGGTLVSLSDSYLKPDGWYGQTFVIPVFFCAITLMLIGILLQKTKYAPDGVRGGVTP